MKVDIEVSSDDTFRRKQKQPKRRHARKESDELETIQLISGIQDILIKKNLQYSSVSPTATQKTKTETPIMND